MKFLEPAICLAALLTAGGAASAVPRPLSVPTAVEPLPRAVGARLKPRPFSPSPARLLVTAREYDLTLSRTSLRAGRAVIELHNLGEDEHDLALRRLGPGASTKRIRTTAPGGLRDLDVSLRPGRYRLWCTLLDHRARGMRATLVARS